MRLLSWNIQWGRGLDGRVDLPRIVAAIQAEADGHCHALLMSNGSFGGIYQRLRESLGE